MARLFLSVDMVGSTEFKARFTGQGAEAWLGTFKAFFTSFPLMVAGQIGHAESSQTGLPRTQQFAGTTQFQILFRDQKAI